MPPRAIAVSVFSAIRSASRVARPRGSPKQELAHHRGRELRRDPEARVGLVERLRQLRHRVLRRGRSTVLPGIGRDAAEVRGDVGANAGDLGAPVGPGLTTGLEHLPERRHPVPRLPREVRAGEERLRRPAVRTHVIGQPPWPVIAWVASM